MGRKKFLESNDAQTSMVCCMRLCFVYVACFFWVREVRSFAFCSDTFLYNPRLERLHSELRSRCLPIDYRVRICTEYNYVPKVPNRISFENGI